MPGRPQKMIDRVSEMEMASFQLADQLVRAAPDWVFGPDGDEIGLSGAWRDARAASVQLWGAMTDLADALRYHHNIPGECVTEHLRLSAPKTVRRKPDNASITE